MTQWKPGQSGNVKGRPSHKELKRREEEQIELKKQLFAFFRRNIRAVMANPEYTTSVERSNEAIREFMQKAVVKFFKGTKITDSQIAQVYRNAKRAGYV